MEVFHFLFDNKGSYYQLMVFCSNLIYWVTHEIWGDRAMFIRSELLRNQEQLIDLPIMEDVELSRIIRKHGKAILLEDKVQTAASTFERNGPIRNTLRIIWCRLWYALGGNANRIYQYYYNHQGSSI